MSTATMRTTRTTGGTSPYGPIVPFCPACEALPQDPEMIGWIADARDALRAAGRWSLATLVEEIRRIPNLEVDRRPEMVRLALEYGHVL